MRKPLKVPKFKSEDEEREYWDQIDLGDYLESSDFIRASFPNLKPTSKSISIRIPKYIIFEVKQRANAIDIPYQALIKKYIADGLKRDSAISRK